jgi:hypothetical protein
MMYGLPKFRNRKGVTLVVVAVSLVAILSVMALAIDLGMGFSARNEAQRTADAAALAGASAFLDSATWAPSIAPRRAKEYVAANYILATTIDSVSEAAVNVSMLNNRVRVTVWRRRIPTWFARMFGVDTMSVSATAVAEAVDAGAAKCVRPWGVQDLWHEAATNARPTSTDKYQPGDGDQYRPAVTQPDASATGYGRSASDNGSQITIKSQRPTTGPDGETLAQPGPGEFMVWSMPEDPTLDNCSTNGSTGSPNYIYQNSICSCNKNSVQLGTQVDEDGDTVRWDPGNRVGPTASGLEALVETDPGARWNSSTGSIENSEYPALSSPRVVKIGLIPPLPPPPGQNWTQANMPPVTFTTFALMFIEGFVCIGRNGAPTSNCNGAETVSITGRFLYNASGEEGPVAGNLVKYLRLVE